MTTPYRESCQKCSELNEQIQELKKCSNKQKRTTWGQYGTSVLISALVIFGTSVVGAAIYGYAMKPDAPDLCQDKAEIITYHDNVRLCHPDAILSVEKFNDVQMIMKCVCPHSGK